MESLEAVVRGEECSEAVKTLSRAPEVAESKRGKVVPASAQVKVVCDRAREARAAGGCVRYFEILPKGKTIESD